jgi:hypothetical protein
LKPDSSADEGWDATQGALNEYGVPGGSVLGSSRICMTRRRCRSAVPGINVVPSGSGMEIQVRYITRAHERHETRRRIYNAVLGLMHGKRPDEPPAGTELAHT